MVLPNFHISQIGFLLLGLFILIVLIQLFYYLYFYLRIFHYKSAHLSANSPISVIICARNEAVNLSKNLPAILNQKHTNYEVIVVNDCSTDNTDEVLGSFLQKYKNLRTTHIVPDHKFSHGKKLAVTLGIKAAKHEWLVFTDADCEPVSDQWLNCLQENFNENTELVLGYGGYQQKKGFLNAYIRFDTLIIAMQYLSYALSGKPYMGVGRNLAYRKSLFFKNKGFASHYGLASGDDDLFVNETANAKNCRVEFRHESHTLSEPEANWTSWFKQKKRHLTTANRYKSSHIFLLGFENFSRFLFYTLTVFLLVLNISPTFIIVLAGLRCIIVLTITKLAMKRLNERNLLLWVIIFDILALFINFSLYLASLFRSNKLRWK